MAEQHLKDTLKRILWPLRLTLLGLWSERLARAFWPLWSLCFVAFAALTFGLQDALPLEAAWAIAALWALAVSAALAYAARAFRKPTKAQALARLDANLPGRPLAALADAQASGEDDPASVAVWQAHQGRMAARAALARPVSPDPQLAPRDPYALRYVALTGLVMALLFGSLWRVGTLSGLLPSGTAAQAAGPSWEAWAEPPRYTGKPRLYLNEVRPGPLDLPVGSKLTFRLYGEPGALSLVETITGEQAAPASTEAQFAARDLVLRQSGDLQIDGAEGAAWQITALADLPPQIAAVGEMGREADGRFKQGFSAQDDYGVVSGQVSIQLDLAAVDRRYGLAAPPEPQAPVVLDLPMPVKGNRADLNEILIDDLSKHVFANLPVVMTFSAQDAAGQKADAAPLAVVLPGKRFFDPLAAALIEMRRDLLWARTNARRSLDILKAVTFQPEGFIRNERAYLRLRVLMRSLEASQKNLTPKARDDIAEELWQVALLVEEGDLKSAMERLQRAQDRLDEAMRNGASPSEVESLMEELRKALDDYMRQLAEEAERNPDSQLSQNQDSLELGGDQLRQMLDELQKLMEEGRMAEAQELMEMLRQLMENMQVTQGEGGQGQGQGQGQGNQAMRDLGQTLRDQQGLADDSFRDLQQGPSEGEGQGEQGEGGPQGKNLAERQGDLRNQLNRLGRGDLPGDGSAQGEAGRQEMDRAGRAMREAEDALRRGDLPQALDRQAEALEALREGMRNLGEALAEERRPSDPGQEQGQAFGRNDPNSQRDPLGRPPGETGRIGSDRNMLQGEDLHRHAQDLLDEIRRRSGEQARPEAERDYLRRLLDQF